MGYRQINKSVDSLLCTRVNPPRGRRGYTMELVRMSPARFKNESVRGRVISIDCRRIDFAD